MVPDAVDALAMDTNHVARGRGRVEPGLAIGAVAGGLTVLGFTILHDLVISDIWFSLVPMLIAGVICGLCLAWSYRSTTGSRSAARWYGYNASYLLILMALGAVSLVVLEPRFTIAELMVADDPLGDLLPPAVPLLIVGPLVGTAITWALFGRNRGSIVPILVTQYIIGFLLGHNLAALGAVVWVSEIVPLVAEFVALTGALAVAYAISAHLMAVLRLRWASRSAQGKESTARTP